jgi:hypothetical protein
MLTDWWRDFFAIAGFILTVVGLLLTLAGLGWTIWQVYLIKTVATATQEATANALREIRGDFEKYSIANVRRYLPEALVYIEQGSWGHASLRLYDVAEQTAQMARVMGNPDEDWLDITNLLRGFAETAKKCASGKIKRFPHEKWTPVLSRLHAKIDIHVSPLPNV